MIFYINKYYFFAPKLEGITDDEVLPDVDFMPPMFRRKLSQSIKMSIYAAYHITKDDEKVASVYASRFGEWGKTIKQLQSYFNEKTVSPSDFGLSVHNAAIGMFSVFQGNNKPYTSVSGNEFSFDVGLIEALSKLNKEHKMLYVSSDEKVPDILKTTVSEEIMPLSIALMLGKTKEEGGIGINIEFCKTKNDYTSNYKHSKDFIEFLTLNKKKFIGNNYKLTRTDD